MKHGLVLGSAILLVAGAAPAFAEAPTVSGLIQVWGTQMMDSNLRNNVQPGSPYKYYNLRSEFTENSFVIRRAEIKFAGSATDNLRYEAVIDPSINTSATNPSILQDCDIIWVPMAATEVKVGQFKTLQTYEGNISSSELLFAERSQLGRVFGDKRDRGVVGSYTFGDPKGFSSKISAGVFNGMSDAISGKGNDTNAQKDFVARLDFTLDTIHRFGAYTLQGTTDKLDNGSSPVVPDTFAGAAPAPSASSILGNKDKTTNMGVYYVFQSGPWHASVEYMTGLLGRRYASVETKTANTASRQHLDQKFEGYYLTGGYTIGHNTFLARYDVMNYNKGDDWYTATNPYKQGAADYTPKYSETIVGYTYAWKPEKVKAANFKLNYIMRSKNFLKPLGTQTTEQGGDTLVAALQVAF